MSDELLQPLRGAVESSTFCWFSAELCWGCVWVLNFNANTTGISHLRQNTDFCHLLASTQWKLSDVFSKNEEKYVVIECVKLNEENGYCIVVCVSIWACLFDFFQWPFRSYISAGIVYVSRSSNTAITPVWAGLTLWDLWATVWFNNMQVLTLTLILSLGPCLYLLTCLTFSFLPLITSKKHTHAHTRIMQEKVSSFLKPKQHFFPQTSVVWRLA